MTIQYYNTNILPIKLPDNTIENGGVSAWQGIRYIAQDTYILCGTTNPNPNAGNGLLFLGNISFTNGVIYYLNVPKEGGGEYYTSLEAFAINLSTTAFTSNTFLDAGIFAFNTSEPRADFIVMSSMNVRKNSPAAGTHGFYIRFFCFLSEKLIIMSSRELYDIPDAAASWGRSEVRVMPGMVLISRTYILPLSFFLPDMIISVLEWLPHLMIRWTFNASPCTREVVLPSIPAGVISSDAPGSYLAL